MLEAAERVDMDPVVNAITLQKLMESLVILLGRKKGERLITLMAELLAQHENLSAVFPLRPAQGFAERRRASQMAAARFEACLPVLLARVPRE